MYKSKSIAPLRQVTSPSQTPILSTQKRSYAPHGDSSFRNLKPKPVNWYQRQPMYLVPIHGPWKAHDYSGVSY